MSTGFNYSIKYLRTNENVYTGTCEKTGDTLTELTVPSEPTTNQLISVQNKNGLTVTPSDVDGVFSLTLSSDLIPLSNDYPIDNYGAYFNDPNMEVYNRIFNASVPNKSFTAMSRQGVFVPPFISTNVNVSGGVINSIDFDQQGNLYIGGNFQNVNNISRNSLARFILSNGTYNFDANFYNTPDSTYIVNTVSCRNNVLICGKFISGATQLPFLIDVSNNITASITGGNNILTMAIDATNSVLYFLSNNFLQACTLPLAVNNTYKTNSASAGSASGATAIAVASNNVFINNYTDNTFSTYKIAAFSKYSSSNGALDFQEGFGINASNVTVNALAVDPNTNILYIGGVFPQIDNNASINIIAFNPENFGFYPMNPSNTADIGEVTTITINSGTNEIFIGCKGTNNNVQIKKSFIPANLTSLASFTFTFTNVGITVNTKKINDLNNIINSIKHTTNYFFLF